MRVRVAGPQDRDNVLLLLNQLGEVMNMYVSYDPDHVRAHILGKANYDEAMTRDDRVVFVVEHKKKTVGAATFFILRDFITGTLFAHLDDFIIDKKHRGCGYGTALLEYIKTYAKKHGICSIQLTSSLPLTQAHRFYEKRGGVFARKVIKFIL